MTPGRGTQGRMTPGRGAANVGRPLDCKAPSAVRRTATGSPTAGRRAGLAPHESGPRGANTRTQL